ncbi:UvrD-helicase domain-containing protein [Corynebacterium renale]|uniref:DNA 3'-5' helicase n=1 Tax=Corynebacterium renale TaxID=1724 RepID=A0A2A9DQN4_9CORY|nr:UvrD-helicase domain-containing protein [Corynebacterium renale]PFG28229.1 ATP-dependent exoDNAse (exonuclease V) beta subunit [Corynebacterium renale]SQI19671.1 hypothetical helicase [Corynebacterium renale]
MSTLIDAASRDEITYEVDRSLFVEAGAGSGKTHQLVQRLLTLLIDREEPIQSIAAITFTKKAAGELKDRLRSHLTEIAAQGRTEILTGQFREFGDTDRAKKVALDALTGLPSAAIDTIHAFCLRLLKLYPLEACVSPGAEAVSGMEEAVAGAQRSDELAEIIMDLIAGDTSSLPAEILEASGLTVEKLQAAVAHLDAHDFTLRHYGEIYQKFDEHWGELTPTMNAPIPAGQLADREYLNTVVIKLQDILQQCTNPDDALYVRLETLVGIIRQTSRAAGPGANIAPPEYKLGSAGSKPNWGRPGKEVRDEVKEILDEWAQRYASPTVAAAATIRRFLAAYAVDHARARARTGTLEHYDQLYLAEELVRDTAIARHIGEQFRYVLIDEFQDTDPTQLSMVRSIVEATGNRPGHVFTVGDPKQSIYRFRRADVNSYLRARAQTPAADIVQLQTNFRSRSGVLSVINAVFREAFANECADIEFAELVPRPNNDGGSVEFYRHPDVEETSPAAEAADILTAITTALAQGIPLEDIAVLCTTHAVARDGMELLSQHGIPYVSEGSSMGYQEPDIEDLHTLIRAIADPSNTFTRAAALRTSLLGVPDSELSGDTSSQLIDDLRQETRGLSADQVLEHVAQRTDLRAGIAYRNADTENRLHRLDWVIAQAREFARTTGGGLRAYLRWVDGIIDNRDSGATPSWSTDRPGVRFLTMHGAKGREFKAVILAGMCRSHTPRADSVLFDSGTGIAEFSLGGVATPKYKECADYEKEELQKEDVRLLYVAATRAEDFLAVPLEIGKKKDGKFYKTRGKVLAETVEALAYNTAAGDQPQISHVEAPTLINELDIDYAHIQANKEILDAAQSAASKRVRVSATSQAHLDNPATREAAQRYEPVAAIPREAHGTEFGTAVHAVMELAGTAPVEELAETQASLFELEADEVLALCQAYLNSDIVTQAFATEHHREVPVFGTLDGQVIEGVVDLLYREGDHWVIADYKTDVSATAQVVAEYFTQLEFYARILQGHLDAPIARLELLFSREVRRSEVAQ